MKSFLKILFIIAIQGSVFAQSHDYNKQVENEYKLALKAYEAANYELALERFTKCTSIDSTCFEAFIGIAQINYQNGDYSTALKTCVTAGKLQPNNASLFGIEGKSNLEIGEYELAEDQLKRAVSLGDSTYENLLALARTLSQLEKFPTAEYYFAKLFEEKHYFEILYYRGKMYELKEEYDLARSDYESALEISPGHTKTSIRLINVLISLQEFDQIPALLTEAENNATTKIEKINFSLVSGYYQQQIKEFDLAEAAYMNALNLDNKNIVSMIYLSALYIDKGEYNNAVDKCNEVLAIDEENQVAYFNRGIANEMLRNLEEACSDWEQAFLLGSDQAVEYLNGPVCNE